jgi:hypothetical protein
MCWRPVQGLYSHNMLCRIFIVSQLSHLRKPGHASIAAGYLYVLQNTELASSVPACQTLNAGYGS